MRQKLFSGLFYTVFLLSATHSLFATQSLIVTHPFKEKNENKYLFKGKFFLKIWVENQLPMGSNQKKYGNYIFKRKFFSKKSIENQKSMAFYQSFYGISLCNKFRQTSIFCESMKPKNRIKSKSHFLIAIITKFGCFKTYASMLFQLD